MSGWEGGATRRWCMARSLGYLMTTERALPEVSTDEVSEAKPVQAREVLIQGAELG